MYPKVHKTFRNLQTNGRMLKDSNLGELCLPGSSAHKGAKKVHGRTQGNCRQAPAEEKEIQKEISLNVIANILGLGNAATPLGLKAMKSMQKKNPKKDTLTNSMITFIVLNTASLQIIPTTVIAIRSSMNSKNPTSIVFPVWIATICAAIAGITATKLFIKLTERKK